MYSLEESRLYDILYLYLWNYLSNHTHCQEGSLYDSFVRVRLVSVRVGGSVWNP